MLKNLYDTFDPEIKIVPAQGKTFVRSDSLLHLIKTTEGVALVSEVIEDNVLIRHQGAQVVGRIKGVDEEFLKQQRLDTAIVSGIFLLQKGDLRFAVVGAGIQMALGLSMGAEPSPLQLWYPKAEKKLALNPDQAFIKRTVIAAGVFSIERDYDTKYVFTSLDVAQELFRYKDKRSYLEIQSADNVSGEKVVKRLQDKLGDKFNVLGSDDQHAELLRILKIEKLFVALTIAFIIFIASLNIFFSLSMLVIEKRRDIAILKAIGATTMQVRKIFWIEGVLTAATGTVLGLILGLTVTLLQKHFELVPLGLQSGIVLAYPVDLRIDDFIFAAAISSLVTLAASFRPALQAGRIEPAEEQLA